ncbi:transglycosylase domain-containing protein [Methyloversatilis sp. XJ19-49]|uniref:transglycosylase domain-containing protein n=1 Tax=Methyloversatilis sp. XJ19-49 TaxID=2963429 RepID=UPI00211BAC7D|nr:transglycosylase domain-containing protein [Methyloversatilis sp. XJ19-49]MCQ9376975.1 transglycosylase domain-containing protein [Methyloversatilis sp. XJ19-49]
MRCALSSICLLASTAAHALAPDFDTVRDAWRPSEARLLDRYGEPLAEVRVDFDERRLDWVSARALSQPLVRALLAAEDKRFLQHDGVDWQALAGATWDNLWRALEGRRPRGASTLTMQLAGLIDPALRLQGTRRSVGQKWDQAAAARQIERRWNKAQILEAYFNLAPFRSELRGIGAASRGLFGKDPDAVDAVEAVLLAALLRGPNASADKVAMRACAVARRLDPAPDCRDIRTRADAVLLQRYRIEPRWQDATALARRLLREPGEQRPTTLDARLQRRALQALGGTRGDTSVVVLENLTGEVRVWGGGPDNADTVLQRQPAGSALQPFMYGMAIEQRWLTAASVLDDSPAFVTLPLPPGLPDREPRGAVSVRSALGLGADIPALRVRALIGDDALDATLQAHGLTAASNGGARASLIELANAYRTFASAGLWSAWRLEPVTAADALPGSPTQRLWSPAAAWIVGDLLTVRPTEGEAVPRPWAALMNGRSADRSVWWSVGFTRHYTVALRAPRPVAATWLALIDALDGPPLEPAYEHPGAPPGVERLRVQFEPAIEPARDEYFLPGTQQAFVDATVRDVSEGPRIVLPTSGVKLVSAALPAGRQTMLFEARPPLPGLVWLINGERLQAVEGRALWSPRPGRHRLALLDAAGLQVESMGFEVRLDDSAPPTSAP